ncbi:hypothetical protein TCAL_08253 [Tigriopus californicus]|uniref:Large ribosomal subunit protein mL64 n=2 Tax=Tigriopus californicus TaxID=6832 RepID=A0A553NXK9_TIGCA|nr:hypothetical protein TCAL_08253 [Tigriopus californicus]
MTPTKTLDRNHRNLSGLLLFILSYPSIHAWIPVCYSNDCLTPDSHFNPIEREVMTRLLLGLRPIALRSWRPRHLSRHRGLEAQSQDPGPPSSPPSSPPKPSLFNRFFRSRQQSQVEEALDDEFQLQEDYHRELEYEQRRTHLQRIRNKSGLRASDRRQLLGHAPLTGLSLIYNDEQRSPRYQRGLWGRYGTQATGLHPGVAWPNARELHEAQEYERVLYDGKSLKQLMQEDRESHRQSELERQRREEEVEAKFLVMERQIKQAEAKVEQRLQMAQKEKAKREAILAEMRQEYGYDVDPSLPQFAEDYAQREKILSKQSKGDKKKVYEDKKTKSKVQAKSGNESESSTTSSGGGGGSSEKSGE